MSFLRLSLFLILILSSLGLQASIELEARQKITISAFNIRFYGLIGPIQNSALKDNKEVTAPTEETRDPYLKDFLKNSVPASDIFVFEEIVDVPRFKTLLPSGWDCISYTNPSPSHQHVVLCHSPKYAFEKEPTDDNFLIDEVAGAKSSLRPAVTAIVTDLSGNQLFRIVGVHLKAAPSYSKMRVNQADIISHYLTKVKNPNLPVVVTGDFNTYPVAVNGNSDDDTKLILNSFNSNGLGMKRLSNDLNTFRSIHGYSGMFDHFYLSNSLTPVKPLQIYSACNANISEEELNIYNKNISDHCPITAEIALF